MMNETTYAPQLTAQEVADRVRPYVTGRMVGEIGLTLDEQHIYQSNGYWRVSIRPSKWPDPVFPYYEALADITEEITEHEGVKIVLASGEPIDEPTGDAVSPQKMGTSPATVHLKREAVLSIYDEKQGDGGFATALSALAGEEMAITLLEHYLTKQGKNVERVPGVPKTGQMTGRRLDGWLDIDGQLAQIEVKNWGANAVGGRAYDGNATLGWQQFLSWFKDPGLQKVLRPMQSPSGYENKKPEFAIACMWPVMHVQGASDSYFAVDVKELPPLDFEPAFSQLHIFSMSSYLHTLQDDVIDLYMPKTYARLNRLEKVLGVAGR